MTGSSPIHNLPELSVSELSGALKRTVEEAFSRVRLRGEISQPKVAGSGHCYLRLKDDGAVIDAIIWRGTMNKLSLRPEEGMEVIVTGKLTTYPGRSSYQIIIEDMELAGEGALLKLLEERRRRLAAEGLFEPSRKRRPPFLPHVIGVITSPTGAVIRDILHRVSDRFPRRVLIWPVKVQGEGAAEEVVRAIKGFNALPQGGAVPRPDVLIVARGGGSLEDLMAFNEESVVRAAAESTIPLISAVGHETDVTLIDHAADLRAPTPTGAAEMAVPVRMDLLAQMGEAGGRLEGAVGRLFTDRSMRLEGLARGLPDLDRLLADATQRLDEWAERLASAPIRLLEHRALVVTQTAARLRRPGELIDRKVQDLTRISLSLDGAMTRLVDQAERTLSQVSGRLRADRIITQVDQGRRAVGTLADRLVGWGQRDLARRAERVEALGARLESLSHHRVLERGYVVVRDESGRVLTEAKAVTGGALLSLSFKDGERSVRAEGDAPPTTPPAPEGKARAPRKAADKGQDRRQGDLLDGL
ncbi:MAG: exodeoxyribonuclease VII large subunit [Rhodospirillum sp.]|nr:exodeoxyribonuclease VII large subunit [Rhodospirillum sp.]MCF8491243.1 exodeoxyribonuclease VII large subunit [Rhodospirillum sp.]MCF8500781.1 exodeoxyribonuclease VII large subunit [Rhodospirillum sp.]